MFIVCFVFTTLRPCVVHGILLSFCLVFFLFDVIIFGVRFFLHRHFSWLLICVKASILVDLSANFNLPFASYENVLSDGNTSNEIQKWKKAINVSISSPYVCMRCDNSNEMKWIWIVDTTNAKRAIERVSLKVKGKNPNKQTVNANKLLIFLSDAWAWTHANGSNSTNEMPMREEERYKTNESLFNWTISKNIKLLNNKTAAL